MNPDCFRIAVAFMVLLAVDPYWVTFLLGALILAAVWINRYRAIRVGED